MCQHTTGRHEGEVDAPPPIPRHLAMFDAHCHPTDAMASLAANLPSLRASIVAIMATRSQDQQLVADVASRYPLSSPPRASAAAADSPCRVVPAFGWHPWFSHLLYDDSSPAATYVRPTSDEAGDGKALVDSKRAHYQAVLAPSPAADDAFISSLPAPMPLSAFLASTRARLESFPLALVGEIGLDKAFCLPQQWQAAGVTWRDASLTPGGREGRLLSRYRVCMAHQRAILAAQLRLAGEKGRPVSVHGVQAHGVLYDAVSACWKGHELRVPSRRERRLVAPGAHDSAQVSDADEGGEGGGGGESSGNHEAGARPYPPRICLHSYSGSAEVLSQWMKPSNPTRVYVSFSSAVNLSTDAGRAKFPDVVRAVPDDRVLIESDLHVAGPDMDAALEDAYRRVCDAKGWPLDEGVQRIARNFEDFIFGAARRP